MSTADTTKLHTGVVAVFDEHLGYGDVEDADTKRTYFFHCTQIADGTRTIPVGTVVSFRLQAGHLGKWEAIAVNPLEPRATHESSTVALLPPASFPCPCCTAPVEGEPRAYEICGICGWEDDPVQFDDPAYAGGANTMSLHDARRDWQRRQL